MNFNLNAYLGIKNFSQSIQKLIRDFLLISCAVSFTINISSTLMILFVIDKIGYIYTGLMVSIMVSTQFLFDYPTGSLGDKIGQKIVLILSFIFYFAGYGLFLLPITKDLFLLVGILIGFGNAFLSGSQESWFDNNYNALIGELDTERTFYGSVISKIGSITIIPSITSFIVGGLISYYISRSTVFAFQLVFIFLSILIVFTKMNNFPELKEYFKNKKSTNLNRTLIQGIKFFISSKTLFLFLLGLALFDVLFLIFSNLLLFPLFYRYTKSDLAISIMRSLIWILIMPIEIKIATISKNFSQEDFSKVASIYTIVFLTAWMIIIALIPDNGSFSMIGVLAVILISITINGMLLTLMTILRKRIVMKLVPSEIRNSVYSLISSITAFLGIPILPILGYIIESSGLLAGLFSTFIIGLFALLLINRSGIAKNKEKKLQIIGANYSNSPIA